MINMAEKSPEAILIDSGKTGKPAKWALFRKSLEADLF